MKNKKVKDHESDEEVTVEAAVQQAAPTQAQIEAQQLARADVMPDCEISPAAYIFQHQEEHDDLKLYEEKSTKIKCPFCDAVSLSIVEYKPSLIGYLVVILAMLVFGILSLILLPFLVSLTKTALHRCAKCLNEVKSNSYFGFSSMEDKLVSWQIGKFGIILTRKTLLYMVIVLTGCLAIYVFVLVEERRDHQLPITAIAWSAYRQDCGISAFEADHRGTVRKFELKYRLKGVMWRGWVVKVNLNEEDPLSMTYHAASILLKMDEDDKEGVHGADLGVSLSDSALLQYKDEIDKLHRGDMIEFKATIQSLGDSTHLHHLHAWSIEKVQGEHKNMDVHQNFGRYKIKPHDLAEAPLTTS